jgi:ribose 5-phosphate isomerase B
LRAAGHDVFDFGDRQGSPDDDYPDFVIPLAEAVARGDMERGIAICGSGVGASVAANKVPGVRACLIHETSRRTRALRTTTLNVICLGGLVVGHALAWELVQTFLAARFSGAERHLRRLAKIAELETAIGPKFHEGTSTGGEPTPGSAKAGIRSPGGASPANRERSGRCVAQ